ncbi:unnamed protein product [Oppiella nova]|uniref:Ionotropic glutamate receptor L-glutamate and glycine-binding domain-containing protein n=1 Tax=Oppiella nova TaxID=334625 RepID=A0A7R9QEW6_9ACAR|nr:unnamed protein product [Oppiella nova]CAG2164384.1 unnamed protein product [Oppiella nova]
MNLRLVVMPESDITLNPIFQTYDRSMKISFTKPINFDSHILMTKSSDQITQQDLIDYLCRIDPRIWLSIGDFNTNPDPKFNDLWDRIDGNRDISIRVFKSSLDKSPRNMHRFMAYMDEGKVAIIELQLNEILTTKYQFCKLMPTNRWHISRDSFFPVVMTMQNLTVSVIPWDPYIQLNMSNDNQRSLSGNYAKIWNIFQEKFNYSLQLIIPKHSNWNGLVDHIYQNKSDFAINPLYVTTERADKIDFSKFLFSSSNIIITKSNQLLAQNDLIDYFTRINANCGQNCVKRNVSENNNRYPTTEAVYEIPGHQTVSI